MRYYVTSTNGINGAKRIGKIADLKPDSKNANKGTQRGRGLLEKSLRQYGAGRSVLADRDGNLIAGNKTVEIAAEIDLPVRVVQTDGNELVVVQRTDLDLDSKEGRELALADNRVAEIDLHWDADGLQLLADEGVALDEFWNEIELDRMLDTSALELEQGGADAANISDAAMPAGIAGHVRMVQLFFSIDTHAEFMKLTREWAERFGTDNITDTVWAALRHVDVTS
jgi:sporulation protein YlmC with PRC-barrel domain